MRKLITFEVKAPKPRDPHALDAKGRRAGVMHDRRANRGGASNESDNLLEDYLADLESDKFEVGHNLFS